MMHRFMLVCPRSKSKHHLPLPSVLAISTVARHSLQGSIHHPDDPIGADDEHPVVHGIDDLFPVAVDLLFGHDLFSLTV
jgi:hypothetical protein